MDRNYLREYGIRLVILKGGYPLHRSNKEDPFTLKHIHLDPRIYKPGLLTLVVLQKVPDGGVLNNTAGLVELTAAGA